MAAALGYHAADGGRGPRLCFHLKPEQLRHLFPDRGAGTDQDLLRR
ncbi:hypothetical protein LV779_35915 [Streptomyces thinghirensis]|nr:hypothetical protein [Streptomyces thinghirensis]